MTSLIYSPFLLTISMIGLILFSIVIVQKKDNFFRVVFNKSILQKTADYKTNFSILVIPLYFFIVLFSCWQTTEDYGYFMERLRIKLPFLVLPFAFLGMPKFNQKQVNNLLYFLLIILSVTSIGIGINYMLHFEEINMLLSKGHPMPTPRNHIRFSLLLATGIVGGLYLIIQKYYLKCVAERYLIIVLTFFLFIFIHVLSVKSGILCLYFALGILGLRYIYNSKKYLLGSGLLLTLLIIPIIAFLTIPSLNQKISYMFYDYQKYLEGEGGQYADAGRIVSLKAGYEIFREHPVFGVGAGNLKQELKQLYAKKYADYVKPIMPHNQFLFVLASTGLFSFFFFLVAFFVPFFYRKVYHNFFFLGFYMIFFAAFMLEHTIENALGAGTFIFFLLLMLNAEEHLLKEKII